MGEFVFLLPVRVGCVGILFGQRLAKQGGERVAAVVGDGDEAPRVELAVIGDPGGDGQDSLELRGGRAGPDQLARLAGAARLEQRQERRSGR